MAILFTCPICKARRAASESIVGRRVRCADCSNFVLVSPETISQVDQAELDSLTNNVLGEESIVTEDMNVDLDTARSISREPLPSEIEPPPAPIPLQAVSNEPPPMAPVEPVPLEPIPVEPVPVEVAEVIEGIPEPVPLAAAPVPVGRTSDDERWRSENSEDFDADDESEDEDEEMAFAGKEREESEMDMTPMVDVTFLLLIFFMVTASFTVQRSMYRPTDPTEEPSVQFVEQEDDNKTTIEVQIDEFNTYTVIAPEEDPVECPSDQDFRLALRSAKDGGVEDISTLHIRANGNCIHEKVVIAMDAGTDLDLKLQIEILDEDVEF